jgi:sulfur-carrier protein
MTQKAPRVAVSVGSVLLSYLGGRATTEVSGETIRDALEALDVLHEGVLWRVVDEQGALRPHMALFHNGAPTRDLRRRLKDGDALHLLQALSGG